MYLNRLNIEQKNLFIDLCIHASMSDNVFAEEEKAVIDQYCAEMQLSESRYTTDKTKGEVVEKLLEISMPEELRIILFEIAALIVSDNVYDSDEQKFMNDLAEKIGVSRKIVNEMIDCIYQLTDIYSTINGMVLDN